MNGTFDRSGRSRTREPLVTWLVSVIALGLTGTVTIYVSYNEFLDCSIPETHQSANTPLS